MVEFKMQLTNTCVLSQLYSICDLQYTDQSIIQLTEYDRKAKELL